VQAETHAGVSSGDADRTTSFSYLGLTNLVAGETQTDPTGSPLTTRSYSYDAWGHRIAMTDQPNGQASPDAFTYAYDVHGSVSLLIDDASSATASYGYTPYGGADDELTSGDFDPANPTEDQDREASPLNAFRYSGRRLDTGSGSIDMGARRYGPDTGRFLQRDFLAGALGDLGLSLDPLTQGRYNYAGGNPISFVEWDGHRFFLNGIGAGAGAPRPPSAGTGAATYGEAETTSEHRELYGEVPSVTLTQEIDDSASRLGRIRLGIFIAEAEAGRLGLMAQGDDRSFDPLFSRERTRAYVEVDFNRNEVFVQVNPTCDLERDDCRIRPIGDFSAPDKFHRVEVSESASGDLTIRLDLPQNLFDIPSTDQPFGPSIDATLVISASGASVHDQVDLRSDRYPSYELYYDRGTEIFTLAQCRQVTIEMLAGPDSYPCGPGGRGYPWDG
jgi:RHS repeat-associated protein